MKPDSRLIGAIRDTAAPHGLDPVLVAAIAQQESAWNPMAMRYEKNYRWIWPDRDNPYNPRGASKDTELMQQKTSWGLMQIMGAVARERGCRFAFLSVLCYPSIGLDFGCAHLAWLAKRYQGNDLISAYNAGRPVDFNQHHYVDPVLKNMEALRSKVVGE